MRLKPYIGVSLLYILPRHGLAYLDSLCIVASSSRQVHSAVKAAVAARVAYDAAQFLGIEDVFHIEGPLRSGGLVGSSIYGEVKNIAAAKAMVTSLRAPVSKHPWLCVQPVHFVRAVDGDYTVVSYMIVRRSTDAARQIRELASSPRFVAALKRSAPFEPLDDKYRLVGFRRAEIVDGDPTKGAPFGRLQRRYRSLPKLRKMLVSARKIDAFFTSKTR